MAKNYWKSDRAKWICKDLKVEGDSAYSRFVGQSDGAAILDAIHRSIFNDQPLPAWLKEAFESAYRAGTFGGIRSWDEAFGKPARYGSGARAVERLSASEIVFREVTRLKSAGRKLTDEEFEVIGRRLAVGGKTTVKMLLRKARQAPYRIGLQKLLQSQKISEKKRRENPN